MKRSCSVKTRRETHNPLKPEKGNVKLTIQTPETLVSGKKGVSSQYQYTNNEPIYVTGCFT